MHYSRMRTVCCSGHPWEGALPVKVGCLPRGVSACHPPCEQNDRHMLKTLSCRNYIAHGNTLVLKSTLFNQSDITSDIAALMTLTAQCNWTLSVSSSSRIWKLAIIIAGINMASISMYRHCKNQV